jgi:hypothetical protein
MQSINSFYRISDLAKEMEADRGQSLSQVDSASTISSQPSIPDFFNFKDKIYEVLEKAVNLNEKVEISKRGNNFRKMFHIKVSKDVFLFYRSEIKWFSLIKQVVRDCHGKYEGKFDQWLEYMENV